jgi:hypothetical protein
MARNRYRLLRWTDHAAHGGIRQRSKHTLRRGDESASRVALRSKDSGRARGCVAGSRSSRCPARCRLHARISGPRTQCCTSWPPCSGCAPGRMLHGVRGRVRRAHAPARVARLALFAGPRPQLLWAVRG